MQFVYTAALFTQFFMYLLLFLYKYHSELRAEEEPTITGKDTTLQHSNKQV